MDLIIVGASAAGLMAAICAGREARSLHRNLRITALDGAAKLGAKILVSGGGRCNVTHDIVTPDDFAGGNRHQIAKVLRGFDVPATVQFFADLGVELKREDTGKLFPVSDDAHTVRDALLRAAADADVTIVPSCRVTAITRHDTGFTLTTSTGTLWARSVILATGGMALPKSGSDGAGYALAQALGHSLIPARPALVPLLLPPGHWLTQLSGLTLPVELILTSGRGRILHRQTGSFLCTHMGISGPVVLDISRHWIAARADDSGATLRLNLLPGRDFPAAEEWLIRESQQRGPMTLIALLCRHMPQRMALAVVRETAHLDPTILLAKLPRDARRELAHGLTELPLPLTGDRGFAHAEATAGGVPLSEIDSATLASRRCPGLYLAGEILDADGRVGGYNFQWAWCTGRLAGMQAVRALH